MDPLVLIVPCFRERQRLPLGKFLEFVGPNRKILFVDDGSPDDTAEFLSSQLGGHPHAEILRLPHNVGKGEAIRLGYHHLRDQKRLSQIKWVGFWDADLATPLEEVEYMLGFAALSSVPVDAVWGSRVLRLGGEIVRSPLRHFFGRGFATVISNFLRVRSYDSQCGAKLFRTSICDKAFEEKFLSRWIFDVEILLRLDKDFVVECPLRKWRDVPGSSLKIWKEILRVARDILRIRRRYLFK